MNEKNYLEAIDKATAAHADAEQALAEVMDQETQLIQRVQSLEQRKTEIEKSIQKSQDDLVNSLVSGSVGIPPDLGRMQIEVAAINDAIEQFPKKLAEIREAGNRKTGAVMIAQKNLANAKFEFARFKYRVAMKDVWPLVEEVRKLAASTLQDHELIGLADPQSARFGILQVTQ